MYIAVFNNGYKIVIINIILVHIQAILYNIKNAKLTTFQNHESTKNKIREADTNISEISL